MEDIRIVENTVWWAFIENAYIKKSILAIKIISRKEQTEGTCIT